MEDEEIRLNSVPPRKAHRDPLGGAVLGAVGGLSFGVMGILVGLVRGALFLLRGGEMAPFSSEDVAAFSYYLAGFVMAGALVGTLGAYLTSPRATYARFAVGGMIVMLFIVLSDKGAFERIDAFDWGIIVVPGGLLGLAAAHGWLGRD